MPFAVLNRVRVILAVLISFGAGFLPLLLFGSEGLWWARILLIGSSPLIAIALVFAWIFARSISKHPYRWAIIAAVSAVGLSVAWMWWVTGSLFGIASAAISFPASIAFMCLAKLWSGFPTVERQETSAFDSVASET